MRGPYLLRPLQVDISVPTRVGGVYCLGKDSRHVTVVARAETNLREAIKTFWNQYEFFWFEPALTARECYTIQCYCYHKQMSNGGLADATHPTPGSSDFKCPVCGK